MGKKLSLRSIRQWPRWTIIPIGLCLAGFAIVLGLVLEPASQALSPRAVEEVPTLPAIEYGHTLSDGCQNCHFSLSALQATADDASTAEAYLIERSSLAQPHGKLGCVTCHDGNGQAEDKETAHQDLIADMSIEHPERCLVCHKDLPAEIVRDQLRVPHVVISDQVQRGDSCEVYCSDCHGAVGHGFDPVTGKKFCSMNTCLECHSERESCLDCHQHSFTAAQVSGVITPSNTLTTGSSAAGEPSLPGTDLPMSQNPAVGMNGCNLCHIGPHDVATTLTCNCCHTSTKVWEEVDLAVHPVSLPGKHGEIGCFECHRWPNFSGLRYICTDCHEPGHEDWGDHNCTECHDPGTTWDTVVSTWSGHTEQWDQYRGSHLKVSCKGCHFETFTGLDPSCDACHAVPDSHGPEHTECLECH